ncbi:MAG: phosphonopyruvate decarboxylase [Nitrospirae bacterium]|nr:phosphonopyruvate decarboxylase [Nitrospirota bacterium]
MPTALLILDGLADRPLAALGGRTPLMAAATPALDRLAAGGAVGRWQPTPPGRAPGSEVGVFACLGEPIPAAGRAAFEALGRGIALAPGETAFRVTPVRVNGPVDDPETVLAGGAECPFVELVALAAWLASLGIALYPCRSGRHIMVVPGAHEAGPAGPHQLAGMPLGSPLPAGVPWRAVQRRLGGVALWPWGAGGGWRGPLIADGRVLVCGVPLVRGIGLSLGMTVAKVPGATGDADTDLGAKGGAALAALAEGNDVVVHVEGTDMAAHRLDPLAKRDLIARVDRELVAPLAAGGARILVTCDHGTSSADGRHLDDPVPFLLWDPAVPGPGGTGFDEGAAGPVWSAAAWKQLLEEAPVRC